MYFGNILFGQIHFGKIHFGTIHFGNIQFAVCTMHFIQYILWQDTLWKEESGWQNIRDIWDGKKKARRLETLQLQWRDEQSKRKKCWGTRKEARSRKQVTRGTNNL